MRWGRCSDPMSADRKSSQAPGFGDVLKLDISEICIRLLFSGGKNIFFEEVCSDGVSSGFLSELWE